MKLTGYCDRWSARPGDTLTFYVSAALEHYDVQLVRIRHWDPNPRGPGLREYALPHPVNGRYRGGEQAVRSGSCMVVAKLPSLPTYTLAAWIWPTLPESGHRQGVFSRQDDGGGMAVVLEPGGCLALEVRDADGQIRTLRSGCRLVNRRWCLVALVIDQSAGRVALFCEPRAFTPHLRAEEMPTLPAGAPRIALADAPLLIAAERLSQGPTGARPENCFNGKVADPVLVGRALTADELAQWRAGARPVGAVARWDFYRNHGSTMVEDTEGGYHGEVMNRPTRLVTGPWYAGDHACPAEQPEHYNAAHFHDDDLADCAWRPSFTLEVPRDLRSGCYAVRLNGEDAQDRIPFFVRPEVRAQRASLAVLLPTLSYMAYANVQAVPDGPYAPLMRFPNRNPQPEINEYLKRNRMRSLYDDHDDGSGICMVTMLRPMYSVRPTSQEAWIDSPHQLPADLHLIDWLEEKGIEYDVLTDHDLHFEGVDALLPYAAVLSGTHAEYWSAPMLDALETYQHEGGRFVYLSGNGLYWVTALSEDGTLAEVRRMNGTRAWTGLPGEGFVSLSGEPGDTWRSRGRPPQRCVGVGFASQGFDIGRPYRRTEASYCRRARFIFAGVEEELIGDCPALVCRHGAASFEVDRVDHDLGTPIHALVLATATDFSDSYQGVVEDAPVMAPVYGGTTDPNVRADMVFYETPKGGAVFSVGAIGFCSALSCNRYDNNVSTILENVVRHFSNPAPLPR